MPQRVPGSIDSSRREVSVVKTGSPRAYKHPQFFLQSLKLADAISHLVNVLIGQQVDVAAVVCGRILVFKQGTNLVQRHVQAAAVADELPVVARGSRCRRGSWLRCARRRQQPFARVVADGRDLGSGGLSQHGRQFAGGGQRLAAAAQVRTWGSSSVRKSASRRRSKPASPSSPIFGLRNKRRPPTIAPCSPCAATACSPCSSHCAVCCSCNWPWLAIRAPDPGRGDRNRPPRRRPICPAPGRWLPRRARPSPISATRTARAPSRPATTSRPSCRCWHWAILLS